MSYIPLKATLGICVSLASHVAFAETAPTSLAADVPAHSYASVVNTLASPQQQTAQATPAASEQSSPDASPLPASATSAVTAVDQQLSSADPSSVQTMPTNTSAIQTTEAATIVQNGDPSSAQVSADPASPTSTNDASAPTPTDASAETPNGPLNRIGQTLGYSIDKIGEIGGKIGGTIGDLGSKIAVNATASQPDPVKDPFENFNRAMWSFNLKLDKYILLPVTKVYVRVVPEPIRNGVNNFFINLGQPWTAVNNLLQGHPGTAVESLSRFIINTTTTLGFYDTAGYLGIPKSNKDFGETLGVWGIGSGPFLMLPFLGPSTVRDGLAEIVDQVGYPPNYLPSRWETAGTTVIRVVNTRSRLIGLEHFVEGDQYSLVRDIYLQNREYQIHGGSTATPSPDGFGDDGFGDDGAKSSSATAPAASVSTSPATASPPAPF